MNKWTDFRAGKDVEKDIEPYLGDKIKEIVLRYLKRRTELDIFETGKDEADLSIPESQTRKVVRNSGSKIEAVLIGESRGIVDVMSEINRAMLNWRILTTLPKMKWFIRSC